MRFKKRTIITSLLMGLFAITTFSGINLARSKNNDSQQVKADADTYWASVDADSLTAQQLQTKIAGIIHNSPTTKITYDDLWTAYATSDVVPGKSNKIWDMYGGFQFTYKTDQAGNYSKEGDAYNREHSIPKSWWDKVEDMRYSDLIHLVPTDGYVNNKRGNYAFGEVSSSTYSYSFNSQTDGSGNVIQTAGTSKLGTGKVIDGKTAPATVFEPDDQYKGDFARIYYYFATRYGVNNLLATSGDGGKMFSTSTDDYLTPYGRALLNKWHVQDPVSEKETTRNDAVQSIQKNRNPFVDHPEWADKIFGSNYKETHGGGSSEPYIRLTATDTSMEVGDSITLTAEVVNETGGTIQWYVEDSSTDVVTLSATSGATITVTGVGTGNKNIYAHWGDLYKSVNIVVTEQGGGGGDTPEEGTYTRLTSIADIDSSARYVLGVDGTGFHYSGTSSWGLTALPDAQTPIYYTLTKNAGNTSFTAKATIDNTVYYLTVPTSKNFAMSTSSTNIKLGTTADIDGDDTSYAVANVSSTDRHLRINGSNGLRSYDNKTGVMAYFYKVDETLNSISVKTDPTKVNYTEGEYFDPTGLVINLNYSSGSTELAYAGHSSDFTFNPSTNTPLDADDEVIEITYGGKTCYLTIEVEEAAVPATLESITLSGQTTTYYVGDTFSFNGTVTAHYDDESSKTVTPTSVSSPNMSTAGTKTVTVSYTENSVTKTATYDITVNAVVLSSIAITTPPTKTTYYVGDTFSSAGLVVTATYSNGSTSVVSPTTITSPDMSTAGTKAVTVSYTYNGVTKYASFNITVNAVTLTSISIEGQTTQFNIGDTFSFGGTVTAHYNNGSTSNVTASATFSGYNMSTKGTQTVTVSYGGQTTTYSITVTDPGEFEPITEETIVVSDTAYKTVRFGSSYNSNGTSGYSGVSFDTTNDNMSWTVENANNNNNAWNYIKIGGKGGAYTGTITSKTAIDKMIGKVDLTIDAITAANVTSIKLYMSSNGSSWTEVGSFTKASGTQSIQIESPVASRYYKVEAVCTQGSNGIISISKIEFFDCTTSVATMETITAESLVDFHPGETLDLEQVVVTGHFDNGATKNIEGFTVDGSTHMFTYADSNDTYSYQVSYKGYYTTLEVNVTRVAHVKPSGGETLTLASSSVFSTIGGANDDLKDGTITYQGIVYTYYQSYYYSGSSALSFGNSSTTGGYLVNSTKFSKDICDVSITSSGRTINIRYSEDGEHWDLKANADPDKSYRYFKLDIDDTDGTNYSNIKSITITFAGAENAVNVANYIMYEDTPNQCETKFDIAQDYFESMTKSERSTFMTSNDYVIATARERFQDWAKYHGKQIAYQDEDYIIKDARIINLIMNSENSGVITIVTIIGLIGVTSLAGYFIIKKRKEH